MVLLIANFSENINYDDAMFKCHSISIRLGDAVVVYRCKYDSEYNNFKNVSYITLLPPPPPPYLVPPTPPLGLL